METLEDKEKVKDDERESKGKTKRPMKRKMMVSSDRKRKTKRKIRRNLELLNKKENALSLVDEESKIEKRCV